MLSLNRLNLALCLSLFFCGATHLFGNEDLRSTLEIRLVDLDGSSSDIKKLEFSYEVYSAALSQPLRQSGVVVETTGGIVPLPDSLPNFGRTIIWVNVDSLQKGFRYGVGEYSYKLDKNKSEPPALIKLEQGDVVTGQVLDLNDSPKLETSILKTPKLKTLISHLAQFRPIGLQGRCFLLQQSF